LGRGFESDVAQMMNHTRKIFWVLLALLAVALAALMLHKRQAPGAPVVPTEIAGTGWYWIGHQWKPTWV
jgi:hypothetical protein